MLRASLITACTLAALAVTGSARADELCMSMPELPGRSVRIVQSIEAGPFFSSDGSTLISQAELDDLLARADDSGAPLAEIHWCWSGNADPRCSPSAPSPDDAPHGLRSARNVVAVLDDLMATRRGGVIVEPPRPEAQGSARDGVRSRIDRPPQA